MFDKLKQSYKKTLNDVVDIKNSLLSLKETIDGVGSRTKETHKAITDFIEENEPGIEIGSESKLTEEEKIKLSSFALQNAELLNKAREDFEVKVAVDGVRIINVENYKMIVGGLFYFRKFINHLKCYDKEYKEKIQTYEKGARPISQPNKIDK